MKKSTHTQNLYNRQLKNGILLLLLLRMIEQKKREIADSSESQHKKDVKRFFSVPVKNLAVYCFFFLSLCTFPFFSVRWRRIGKRHFFSMQSFLLKCFSCDNDKPAAPLFSIHSFSRNQLNIHLQQTLFMIVMKVHFCLLNSFFCSAHFRHFDFGFMA